MRSFLKALLCVNLLLAGLAVPAHATDFFWQGIIDNEWDTTTGIPLISNWSGGPFGGIPGSGDTATFQSSSPFTSIDVEVNRTIRAATYSAGVDYTLIGGSAITLTLADGDITTLGSATHGITTNVGLGSAGVWDIDNPLFEVSGNITGSFGLSKTGSGTLLLTGNNSYSGTTTIDGGIVQVGDGGTSGSIAGNITNNAQLIFNRSNDLIYGGVITGTGDLTKTGAGRLTLSGVGNNVGGTLNLNGGVVEIAEKVVVGAMEGGGDLELGSQELVTGASGDDTLYSGVVTGDSDSRLRHKGSGTLTLTGGDNTTPSSFGTLRAHDGTVVVDGALIDVTSTDFSDIPGALLATIGDITVQNGADVRMAAGSHGIVRNSTLTVAGSGTSLMGDRLDAAETAGATQCRFRLLC